MSGAIINHIIFGKGTVTFCDDRYIKVMFDNTEIGEKSFSNPSAFIKFIAYEDKNLQKDVEESLRIIKDKADSETARIENEKAVAAAAEKERIKAAALLVKRKVSTVKKKRIPKTAVSLKTDEEDI